MVDGLRIIFEGNKLKQYIILKYMKLKHDEEKLEECNKTEIE